jgi:Glycosyltransferase family 17
MLDRRMIPRRTQVIDCFVFNDELILLEVRLRLLDPVVDRFVLVEADLTHQGAPKGLTFLENAHKFARWRDKITHVVVRDMPKDGDAWNRENHQRRAVARGIGDADPMDIAIVSDVDEIPNPEAVQRLVHDPPNEPVGLEMRFLYYCLDLSHAVTWTLAKACLVRDLSDPQILRMQEPARTLPDAGWHLSYLFPETSAPGKLQAFAHIEYNKRRFMSMHHLRRCRELGVDLFGRSVLQPVGIDDLPEQLTALGRSHPMLIHGPRGRWQSLLARCYCVSIQGSRFFPPWLTDHHPILSFLLAIPVWVMISFARVTRSPLRHLHPSTSRRA